MKNLELRNDSDVEFMILRRARKGFLREELAGYTPEIEKLQSTGILDPVGPVKMNWNGVYSRKIVLSPAGYEALRQEYIQRVPILGFFNNLFQGFH